MKLPIRSRNVKLLSLVLVLQAIGIYSISRPENLPPIRPLRLLPAEFGGWHLVQEGVVDPRVREVLRADDLLTRVYAPDQGDTSVNLFIAYFRTQRTGKAPHSPKNCLPGSGWVPSASGRVSLRVPGRKKPIVVNRYLVSRGDYQSIVMYWYLSRDRVVASEYWAKIYLVLDSIRYHRSDTAIVRVVVPVKDHQANAATRTAERFIQALFQVLPQFPQFRAG